MNCIISSEILDVEALKAQLSKVPSMAGLELASTVSTNESYTLGNPESDIRIAVMDFGVKQNILTCMVERGAYLKVFPAKTDVSKLVEFSPNGFFISNGPGDPASMDYAIQTVKAILSQNKPTFGICLGHQLLALASGAKTLKMKFGHHGANHPVQDVESGRVYITSQNHGFAADVSTLPTNLKVTHISLFDGSLQGIARTDKPAFSFQGHPEASPGPTEMSYLFDRFISMMQTRKTEERKAG
jgi:carbamoyl-phosphate synthase small subunit